MGKDITVNYFKGVETSKPVSFVIGSESYFVEEIIETWIGDDFNYWKVLTDKNNKYLLKLDQKNNEWVYEPF